MSDFSVFIEPFDGVVRRGGFAYRSRVERLQRPRFEYEGCRVVMVDLVLAEDYVEWGDE